MKTRKINIKFNNAKELIKLYVNSDVKINWGAEIKIANKLLSQFPEIEFWREFALGMVRLDSLCVFLNEIHNKRLQDEYKFYLAARYTNKKEEIISLFIYLFIKYFLYYSISYLQNKSCHIMQLN